MEKYRRYKDRKNKIGFRDFQILVGLLLIECMFTFYSSYKGESADYLEIAVVLIPVSLVGSYMVLRTNANRNLILWLVLLLNSGYMAQLLSGADIVNASIIAKKSIIAFGTAFVVAFAYWKLATWLSLDVMAIIISAVQVCMALIVIFLGNTVGSISGQGAIISVNVGLWSVQLLEFVKVLYVFVIALVCCKSECRDKTILGLPREMYLLLYTGVLAILLAVCSEFGTLLVMLITYGIMAIIYSSNRVAVRWGTTFVILGGGTGVYALCVLYEHIPVRFQKLAERFMYFYRPERAYQDSGYQGLQALKAISVGGLFGPDTERYWIDIPQGYSDMIFANLVQTCGLIIGVLVILGFFGMFREGHKISQECEDTYFKGLAMGISVMIATESIYHIAYNMGMAPISGIPLYFISHGVTSLTTGICMISILLVISTKSLERSEYHEEFLEKRIKSVFSFRRRTRRKGPRAK